jgi:peptidoglycan-N-acetylglucosamine deacetylase
VGGVLTNQPFISGRPSKAAALERLIADARALDGMWVAPLGEIARHAAATVEEVRRIRRVECPEGYFDRTGRPTTPAVGH